MAALGIIVLVFIHTANISRLEKEVARLKRILDNHGIYE